MNGESARQGAPKTANQIVEVEGNTASGTHATSELQQLELDFDTRSSYEQVVAQRLDAFRAGKDVIPF